MCRGVSHTPAMAANMPIQRWYYVRRYRFIFAHVRAYAIRPYSFWLIAWGGAVLIFGLRGDFVGIFFFLFEGGLA